MKPRPSRPRTEAFLRFRRSSGGGSRPGLDVVVVPEIHTNSIIISAPPKYMPVLQSLVCRLDQPP